MPSSQPQTQQAQSLHHPDVGAGGSESVHADGRIHVHAAADAHAHTLAHALALPAGSATDALQLFKLRNSRSAMTNSNIDPTHFPSSSHCGYFPPNSSHHDASHPKTVLPLPPTVNLPSGDSTPQRVDSGFEDDLSYKQQRQTSVDSAQSLQIPSEPRDYSFSNLSPIVDSPTTLSTIDGLLGSPRAAAPTLSRKSSGPNLKHSISRTPSLKSAAFARSLGSAASSRVPSPIITAMGDVTPLPSPLLSGDSPGPWRRMNARPPSRETVPSLPTIMSESVLVTSNGESIASAMANQSKRKGLSEQNKAAAEANSTHNIQPDQEASKTKIHTRNRSISEYRPEHVNNIPKRMVSVSGSRPTNPHNVPMKREPHLSESRGLTPIEPPSPAESGSSVTVPASDASSSNAKAAPKYEYFDARGRRDHKMRRWRAVKPLGQGTFSRVVLATSHVSATDEELQAESGIEGTGLPSPDPTSALDRKSLVAVKICEHGPKGGASEDRVEMSLKRELEIMQSIHHPSLVDLKAWNIEPTRAVLVLDYCPGGDLFDVATGHKSLLVPALIRRIFSELFAAVRYLHERHVVHRDIKLENVLVNLTPKELADSSINWQTYPYSVTTLTDLGLSRRVADDEKLTTRCGSEDYAAPEIILGREYDGYAVDSWSLGVLLYALLESRLPFDPPPGLSEALRLRSRTSHRVARIEWQWIKYAGDDGDHEGDVNKFQAASLLGAMEITEGLLRRASSRWPLSKIAEMEWVKNGIDVEGGIRFRPAEDGEEVL